MEDQKIRTSKRLQEKRAVEQEKKGAQPKKDEDERQSVKSSKSDKSSSRRSDSKKSDSPSSKKSCSSSGKFSKDYLTAQKAMLQAELSMLEEKEELARDELLLEQKKKRLDLKTELAKVRAGEDALKAAISENESDLDIDYDEDGDEKEEETTRGNVSQWIKDLSHLSPKNIDSSCPQTTTLNPYAPTFEPCQESGHVHVGDYLASHHKLIESMQLPKTEIMYFDGSPLKYYMFIKSFEAAVHREYVDDTAKLMRLAQYCTGRAKRAVTSCLAMPPHVGYKSAREILQQRFGSPYAISQAWLKQLCDREQVKTSDNEHLRDLADDLSDATETLRAMDLLSEVNSQSMLVKIVDKLPMYLKTRWRREVCELRNKSKLPTIDDLRRFVVFAADEANDPVYGGLSDKDTRTQTFGNSNKKTTTNNREQRHMSVEAHYGATQDSQAASGRDSCVVCKSSHDLGSCKEFAKMQPTERYAMVQSNWLCRNCFASDHVARRCTKSAACTVGGCNRRHHSLLHLPEPPEVKKGIGRVQEKPSSAHVTNGHVASYTSKVALPIVPVKVWNREETRYVETYALLDSGSTGTFCSEYLARQLNVTRKSCELSLSTIEGHTKVKTSEVRLVVSDLSEETKVVLPTVYVRERLQISSDAIGRRVEIDKYPHLAEVTLQSAEVQEVHVLIGQDVPEALIYREVKKGKAGEPYASKTMFGWTLHGRLEESGFNEESAYSVSVHHVSTESSIDSQLEKLWKTEDVGAFSHDEVGLSHDDQRVVQLWRERIIHYDDGHYESPIPFKSTSLALNDNKQVAEYRLQQLKRKLQKDEVLKDKYISGMNQLISKGYAEKTNVTVESDKGKCIWYLPHHPVSSKYKLDKVRIVLDCASQFQGRSLNDEVLQGPDLLNSLVGVLLRFREQPIAFAADVETMYYQVKVPPEQRDVLRFLWWEQGDMSTQPSTFRMTVHPFGGVWSPSCANFVLKKTADDHESEFSVAAIDTVRRSFYVDDCLRSCDTEEQAIEVSHEVQRLLKKGHFNLTKFTSNSRQVLSSFPKEYRADKMKNVDLNGELPSERTLGIMWVIDEDNLSYKTRIQEKPITRRGVLSMASSLFDPLGYASPFTLSAKRLLQRLTKANLGWDEALPDDCVEQWHRWKNDLPVLEKMKIARCVKPAHLGKVMKYELHHFSDASCYAYGAVTYLRMTDEYGNRHSALIMAKCRLAPIKAVTIPRLELMGAVMAVKLDKICRYELSVPIAQSYYWCDSLIVLSYIKSQSKRFMVFVANRLSFIWSHTTSEQWRYVKTSVNPADIVCRGMDAQELIKCKRWLHGPSFLVQEEKFDDEPLILEIQAEDPECTREKQVYAVQGTNDVLQELVTRYSNFYRLKRAVAWILKFMSWLQKAEVTKAISVKDLAAAEMAVLKYTQGCTMNKDEKSSMHKLCPVVINNLMCVGGRLKHAQLTDSMRHPIILPRKHHVVELIVSEAHMAAGHLGVNATLASLRQKFWISRQAVKSVLHQCKVCRRQRTMPCQQQMADLPAERVTVQQPPFTNSGVDYFGPISVKVGRSIQKRYGCLFTCLSSRAVHLEIAHSLDSNSFINALNRFISRRGQPKCIFSDNGTNFVGANHELKKASQSNELAKRGIEWKFNPPSSPHMGGIWERMVRSVKTIMHNLCKEQTLTDEALVTLMCKVEEVLNARPLTSISDDPSDLEALTPNHLLMTRNTADNQMGVFVKQDLYVRKRWRQVQYLADVFWHRWTREYLPLLQQRNKWTDQQRNIQCGDIVIVVTDCAHRNSWPLGRVMETYKGSDGLVRSALIRMKDGTCVRPITKLCMLEASN
jgi:hypothetical protein